MNRTSLTTTLALVVPTLLVGGALVGTGTLNWGQVACWLAFLSALTAGFGWFAGLLGNPSTDGVARAAFRVQWLALLGGAAFLWWILFSHQFQYQYVHDYSSRDMPARYVYAAFWGGQEGTFLLWALLTTTLGLVLLRLKSPLTQSSMFFLNLPVIMLTFVSVVRGRSWPAAPRSQTAWA